LSKLFQKQNKGIALIELMMVITLIAIIMMLAGMQSGFLQRMVVRSELDHLYTTCYMLQRSAMMLQQSQTLIFDVPNNTYAYKTTKYCLPISVRFGVAPGVKGPPSTPDKIITHPITFQENKIIFTPDGIIQPGAVYFTDRSGRYTYALSCAVGHISYLRKYQYTGTWEKL
jgi:prepilin-type N-terminal cleavage/methylation domain-containing protein